jgi:hypothetical protein
MFYVDYLMSHVADRIIEHTIKIGDAVVQNLADT